jgi:hypothetical protein
MIKRLLTLGTLFALLLPQMAFAQGTLLPSNTEEFSIHEQNYANLSADEKETLRETKNVNNACQYWFEEVVYPRTNRLQDRAAVTSPIILQDFLSCSIKTGDIHLWMIPFYISGIANFFIGIAGTISVLFVLLGGFWYMTGGLTDDKEKGKKTIMYALVGLGITLLAWIIVNVIQVAVT